MIVPVHRVVRDEFRRIAPSRRHGKICEAAQIERSARIGENCSEPLGVAAGGKAIDKHLEHSMHVVTADSHHSSRARWHEAITRVVASIEIPGVANSLRGITRSTRRTKRAAAARPGSMAGE